MHNPEKLMPDPTDGGFIEKEREKVRPELATLVNSYLGGELYKDDPAGMALHLSSLNFESPDYEKVVSELEKRCLKKIEILREYRLSLRGDCLPEDYIQKPPDIEINGAVRNRYSEIKTKRDKEMAMLLLMIECCRRVNYMYMYDFNNQRDHVVTTPCLMYGFRKFSPDKKEIDERPGGYFYGHADDIGTDFENIHFIRFPKSTSFDHQRESEEKNKIFPYSSYLNINPDYKTSPADKKRVLKTIKTIGKENLLSEHYSVIDAQLANVHTYFDVLLIIDKILSDIEAYNKSEGVT